jgi:hypothetical protein
MRSRLDVLESAAGAASAGQAVPRRIRTRSRATHVCETYTQAGRRLIHQARIESRIYLKPFFDTEPHALSSIEGEITSRSRLMQNRRRRSPPRNNIIILIIRAY